MPRLLAAPDKFRGTATAAQVATAAARAAIAAGWDACALPMADGGEGTLDALHAALGGTLRRAVVSGPLGEPAAATWLLVDDTSGAMLPPPLEVGNDPLAVIESASAAGRALLPRPEGDDAVRASTTGVGELVLAALDAGARQVVVGVGGSATTDGGAGALRAIGVPARLAGTRLVAACDVTTAFRDAATVFGPQKGASPAQVAELGAHLRVLARSYAAASGVDVDVLEGAGAGGGLAGGLASLGATLVPGFALVASIVELVSHARRADFVFTGEGRLDRTSFEGKVVGGVLEATDSVPGLCVAGDVAPDAGSWLSPLLAARGEPVEVVSLVERFGHRRAVEDTTSAVSEVVFAALGARARSRPRGPAP